MHKSIGNLAASWRLCLTSSAKLTGGPGARLLYIQVCLHLMICNVFSDARCVSYGSGILLVPAVGTAASSTDGTDQLPYFYAVIESMGTPANQGLKKAEHESWRA
jgi:hypothetical protein